MIAACAVAAMLVAVGVGVAGFPRSLGASPNACKPAVIGGKHKCLRVGQVCKARYQAAYKKYGFTCVNGRLRKSRTTTTTTTTTTSPPPTTMASPDEHLANQNRVYGGGQFTAPDGSPRNFAVDAHAEPGDKPASGDIEYGTPGHFSHEQVMCLTVSGNKAAVGAVLTQTDRTETVGYLVLMILVDNGTPLSGNPDQATLQVFGPPNDPTWPAGFPTTCPAPDTAAAFATYFPLNGGDILVQNAK